MAAVGFLRSLWEKPVQEGVWPYWDPMDTVCLRAASMVWKVPGKYGPGDSAGRWDFQPFHQSWPPDSHFSADVLQKCALLALHVMAKEGRDGDGFQVPKLGKNGKCAAQRVQSVRVKAKLGRKTKVCLPPHLTKATCAITRCRSSGCMGPVTRPLFSFRIWSWQRWHQAATWPWTCCARKRTRLGSVCGYREAS